MILSPQDENTEAFETDESASTSPTSPHHIKLFFDTKIPLQMSVEEIDRALKTISQTEQQECKVADNANNKRKWEGNHNGQCTVKGGNCKKVGHITRECRNPTAANEQQTHTLLRGVNLRHFKRHGEKKYYGGSKPLCPKCNYHHDGPCAPKCHRCNIVGHLVRNCRRPTNDNTTNNQRGTGTSQKVNCYECGNQGHYRRDCPERKNQSHKNQIGGTGAHGVVHTLRGEETDQDPNNIKDEIKA
ncbi:putative reverse transcriptase domain-containing protein [Tanacetum coccineum]